MSQASNLLKRSDHFWSNADILSSEAEDADFLDLVGGFYFLASFSGGNGGD